MLLLIALQHFRTAPQTCAEKVVCKKVQETGSFLKFHKTCRPRSKRRIGEANQGRTATSSQRGAFRGANLTGAEGGNRFGGGTLSLTVDVTGRIRNTNFRSG